MNTPHERSAPQPLPTPAPDPAATAAGAATASTPHVPRRGMAWTHRRPGLHKFCNRAVATLFVVSAVGLVYVWGFWEPLFGESLQNLITVSLGGLLLLVGVLWIVFCSRLPRPLAWAIGLLYVGITSAFFASIRRVDFTGDMRASFEWRWQPTHDEVLEKFRSGRVREAAPDASAGEAPTAAPIEITAGDMPGYRGANGEGVVVGPPLPEDWAAQPPKMLWKQPIGGGYSQFSVVGDRLVTVEQRRDREAVVCYSAADGAELWVHDYPAFFDEAMGGPGPRSTPLIDSGRVYVLGATGEFCCLDLASGQPVWTRSLLTEYGLLNSMWAMTSSPLIHDGRLLVNLGGKFGGGLVALDPQTGAELWKGVGLQAPDAKPEIVAAAEKDVPTESSGEDHGPTASGGMQNLAGYASPRIAEFSGETVILNLDGKGLWAHRPADGEALWFHHFENGPGINVAQPIVFPDGRVFLSASYGVGSQMLQVRRTDAGWAIETLWKNINMRCKMTSPVLVDGVLYGLDEGMLAALDPESGKRLWKGSRKHESRGKYGHGQLLATNGRILVLTDEGDAVLIKPDRAELQELATLHVLDGPKTWNPPALAHGRLYIRNHVEMAGYDLCGAAP